MSVFVPVLAVLLAGAFAAYHRLRLATWVAITACVLLACWLLGASHVAIGVLAGLLAVIATALLVPTIRKPLITAPLLSFYTKLLPPLSATERTALEAGTVGF